MSARSRTLLDIAQGRTSPHARAAGRAAKAAGKGFEAELEQTNAVYSALGLATIARAHPPVGGPPRALFYKGKGQVDFVGNVLGVPVAFDAKTEAGAASYKHGADDMHELDFLLDWRRKGGVSFILMLDRERDTLYLIGALEELRAGVSVPVRTHARGAAVAVPLVPALVRTPDDRTLASASGQPQWPWIELASEFSTRLSAAAAAHRYAEPMAVR